MMCLINHRSSSLQMFLKIGALKSLVIFTGKKLVLKPLFNKVAGLFPAFRLNMQTY